MDNKVLNLAIALLSNKSRVEAISFRSDFKLSDGHEGQQGIHLAADLNLENNLNIILEQQLDIDAKNSRGNTPLHLAVLQNQENIVKQLAGKGADPNLKNKSGGTPLMSATVNILPR